MKTLEEVRKARTIVTTDLAKGGLTPPQEALLSGMSVALQWVCDESRGDTMERLVGGEEIKRTVVGNKT